MPTTSGRPKTLSETYLDTLLTEYEIWMQNKGSVGEFATLHEMKESQLRGRLQMARELREAAQPDESNPLRINFNLGEVWELRGDYTIIGDLHAPFTHLPTVERMLAVARRYMPKPRKLVLAGDIFNFDTFSHYPAVVNSPTFGAERNYLKKMFEKFLEVFDEIWWFMGNHDRRAQKFTEGALDATDLLSLVVDNKSKVQISNYGYCNILSGGANWRITHPRNYSRQPLNVAGKLADLKNTNVISFHEHHLGKSYSAGGHVVVNGGCAVDASKLAYVILDDGLSPQMQNGFVTLRDGYAQEWGDENYTDWSKWI